LSNVAPLSFVSVVAFLSPPAGNNYMKSIAPMAQQTPYMVAPGNHENFFNFSVCGCGRCCTVSLFVPSQCRGDRQWGFLRVCTRHGLRPLRHRTFRPPLALAPKCNRGRLERMGFWEYLYILVLHCLVSRLQHYLARFPGNQRLADNCGSDNMKWFSFDHALTHIVCE